MRFQFTLRLTSRAGHQVHQIVGEHESESLEELVQVLNDHDFIIVEEYYRDNSANGVNGNLYAAGMVIMNTGLIGKVKVHLL